MLCYSRKYYNLMHDIKCIDLIKDTNRNNVIKALIVLSKFLGKYEEFKKNLKAYGIALKQQNSIESFLRILKANNSNILDWYNKAIAILRDNEKVYLNFVKATGIRKEEGINSFNLIIKLARENSLAEYYDKYLNCLMHFKYPKLFLRTTKNVYISFIPETLLNEIAHSEPLTYAMLHTKLARNKLRIRISELRDYFATYMRKHNIQKEEIDVLQGRIPSDIFIRHYWSPQLGELRDRVFKALEELK